MTTFALIHGAWHGAWCWEQLIGELERRGHRAVAVDLDWSRSSALTTGSSAPTGPAGSPARSST